MDPKQKKIHCQNVDIHMQNKKEPLWTLWKIEIK